MKAFEVTRGEYDDRRTMGVFADQADAQRFVDHWNLTHLGDWEPAEIAGTVDFYGPGEWQPPREPAVIEGDVIDAAQWAKALPFREAAADFDPEGT
jgi:hypothetical protein